MDGSERAQNQSPESKADVGSQKQPVLLARRHGISGFWCLA